MNGSAAAKDRQAPPENRLSSSPSLDLSEADIAGDTELMATLANETRYGILRLVALAEQQICVCDIEAALDVSQGAVSQALGRLAEDGLVEREKHGRWRYYSASERGSRLLALIDDLRELERK